MSVTRPTGGDGIATAWGQGVSDHVNLGDIILSSDVTTSSASWADLTGLSFTATNGKVYNIEFFLTWECSSTSGGPAVGYSGPTGTALLFTVYTGETASDSSTINQVDTADTGNGIATADASAAKRTVRGYGTFAATATGTFAIRMKRNTAGTVTFHKGGAMRVVSS